MIIYKTLILTFYMDVKLCTSRDERQLRVFRGIFGPKADDVTGGWRKLTGHVARMGR
jgi:hypothetical protein